jgi:hypothetical protein
MEHQSWQGCPPKKARSGFRITNGLIFLPEHWLNARSFKDLSAPSVRSNLDYCHGDESAGWLHRVGNMSLCGSGNAWLVRVTRKRDSICISLQRVLRSPRGESGTWSSPIPFDTRVLIWAHRVEVWRDVLWREFPHRTQEYIAERIFTALPCPRSRFCGAPSRS